MLYWIEGQYWSWKSSLATYIAKEICLASKKSIQKGKSLSWNIIISNIKMDKKLLPNYYYFDDDKLLQVLRTCSFVNDVERYLYTEIKKNWGGLLNYKRNKFSKFYLFFDEAGAIANNHLKLEKNHTYAEYINQNRKNFQDIYWITAKGTQTNKTLREMVDWWYYVKPLFNFWIFKDIGIIRRQQKDVEWKIITEKYIWRDVNGDDVMKEKPIDEYVWFFWKPSVRSYYDDLHKNISDPEKYTDLDFMLVEEVLLWKPELQVIVKKEKRFEPVKLKIPLLLNQENDKPNN